MKKFEKRIAIRLSLEQRKKLECLVNNSNNRNLSEIVRKALKEFLLIKYSGVSANASE